MKTIVIYFAEKLIRLASVLLDETDSYFFLIKDKISWKGYVSKNVIEDEESSLELFSLIRSIKRKE